MTKKKIIEMTWFQVRSKGGITKKEYEKRIKISKSLKAYYFERKRVKRKEKKETLKDYYPKETLKERYRRQKVINYRSDQTPYYISIRVLTINPEITDNGLLMALNELKLSIQNQKVKIKNKGYFTINFSRLNPDYSSIGTEPPTKLSPNEDLILNDMRIHYEIWIERNDAITGVL